MAIVPDYVLWNETELAIIYTFDFTQTDNSPQDPGRFIEIEGLRGEGAIIIPGSGKAAWDLTLGFVLQGTDYEDLIAQMDAIENTIVKNTKYVLKIGRTSSTTKDYKVKRLIPIVWAKDRRTTIQHGEIIFRVNTWS